MASRSGNPLQLAGRKTKSDRIALKLDHFAIMRLLTAVLLVLAACSLSEEEEDRLAAHLQRAQVYFDTGDFLRAQQQADLGLILEPDNPTLNHIMGRSLLGMQDIESVRKSGSFLKAAHKGLNSARTSYSLGEYRLRLAEFMIGRTNLLNAKAVDLPTEEASQMVSRAARTKKNADTELELARQLLETAVAELPENPQSLRLLANCCSHQKDEKRALEVLANLIDVMEKSRAYKNEKLALQQLSVTDESRLRRGVVADIEMEVHARGLVATIYMNGEDFQPAELQLTAILNLNPSVDSEYYNRGLCRYQLGRLGEAASDMRTFLGRTSLEFSSAPVTRALTIVGEYEALQKAGSQP